MYSNYGLEYLFLALCCIASVSSAYINKVGHLSDPVDTATINGRDLSDIFKPGSYQTQNNELRGGSDNGCNGTTAKPTTAEAWGFGMASGFAITLCSVAGVVLTPLTKKPWYKKLLLYLVAAATAALLGNSIFQLLPPAFKIEMNDPTNIWKAATCYMAFCSFFVIERVLNIIFGGDDEDDKSKSGSQRGTQISRKHSRLSMGVPMRDRAGSTIAGRAIASAIHADEAKPKEDLSQLSTMERMKRVKMFAWMLFIGDALENVADGMAMGAGFGTSIALGIGITIAIFSEEFPHKIGDFAIFLNAGMTVRMALVVNVISGATVWLGIVIGLLSAENETITEFIFALAAGVFLYVGLGGLFPEMGEVSEELQEDGESPWLTLTIELAGLATGLGMMIILCYFGDDIENAFASC